MENVEATTSVDAQTLGEEIIVKFRRRPSDQFVRVKKLVKMDLVLIPLALASAIKAGLASFVIRGRTKRDEVQQKRKFAVKLR